MNSLGCRRSQLLEADCISFTVLPLQKYAYCCLYPTQTALHISSGFKQGFLLSPLTTVITSMGNMIWSTEGIGQGELNFIFFLSNTLDSMLANKSYIHNGFSVMHVQHMFIFNNMIRVK